MKLTLLVGLALLLATSPEMSRATAPSPAGAAALAADAPQVVKIKVTGLTCAGCASHVHTALTKQAGVVSNTVEYPGDVAVVTYDPALTNEAALVKAIEQTGYKAQVLPAETKASHKAAKKVALGGGGCCSSLASLFN
ncbi:MAG: hypothetical protein NVS3B25_33070 [Hymenobacter sp.]